MPGCCKQCQHEVSMVEGYEKCCGMAKPNFNFCDDSGHQEGIFVFSETAGRAMTNYEITNTKLGRPDLTIQLP